MAIFKCKMCGGQLEIIEGTTVCTCEYCGTEQTLPKLDSDKKANLYDRANHFRRNNDFDKAMGIYEQILNEDSTDAEAYWSLVLCRYGIEYVEDPVTHKRIPTINRAQYTSIYADENYKAAIEYADTLQKTVYETEAKTIDEIQKGILAISEKEEPFDVFICYKETDENGRRTPDSVLANDLYHQLTQEGFKVFFSRITLEDKLGQEYEPYIFAALNSAKVMVALGTKPEYYRAVWVRNEWSRFLALIKSGAKKMLIPAYKDMDPYDLPEEFSHLQAQDMSKLGFMQDLIRGIKKILEADKKPEKVQETVVVQQSSGGTTADAQVMRGNMALEDGEWEKADGFFEEALNLDPKCAEAYLGKLMAKEKVRNWEALLVKYERKYASAEYERLEACSEEMTRIVESVTENTVEGYLEADKIRKEYTFDRGYDSELSARKHQKEKQLQELQSEKYLTRASQYAKGATKQQVDDLFRKMELVLTRRVEQAEKEDEESIRQVKVKYADFLSKTDDMVAEMSQKAGELREGEYQSVVREIENAGTIDDKEKAIAAYEQAMMQMNVFNARKVYKDSQELAKKCQTEIDLLKEKKRREQEIIRAQMKKEREDKERKIVIISVSVAAVAIAVLIFVKVIVPNHKYKAAEQLYVNGDLREAYEAFRAVNGYKDSAEKAKEILNKNPGVSLPGDEITFGNAVWIVLENENGKLMIVRKYAVEKRPYNEEKIEITWETCTLRNWLNEVYLQTAFTIKEQSIIMLTDVMNEDNKKYGTEGGNDTKDKIFLLSINEVDKYFKSNKERKATLADGGAVWWWLRSPGYNSYYAVCVNNDGPVNEDGLIVDYDYGAVRPALWIDMTNP